MNKIQGKILSALRKVADKIAKHEAEEWPPVCLGQYYQMQRPTQSEATAKAETLRDE